MSNRITYIDALKGLAIILVVWGHIAEKSAGMDDTPFNCFYGSFHMPLFLFLSGLFAYKGMEQLDGTKVRQFLTKKVTRILLPFLVVGGFYSLIVDHSMTNVYLGVTANYWFLPALFMCMLMGLTHKVLYRLLGGGKQRLWLDIILFLAVWGAACTLWALKIEIPYLLSALKSYPYFLLGDFVSRYGVIQKGWLRDSRTQTVAILGYVVAVYIRLFHPINIVNITGIFAITILMCMFARYSDRLPSWLDTIGKRSLEIYVLHWFFLPKFPELGTWITGTGSFNENFVITVLLCTVVCLPIIAACMVIATVIEQSDILNFLCFGIRKKAQERIQIPKQS